MIRFIRGEYLYYESGAIIVETPSGIGFRINVSDTSSLLTAREGDEIGVYTYMQVKEDGMALVRLPSGELRKFRLNCMATIGQVSNLDHENIQIGKAGRKRHMGIRPTVRGSVMNPCDHPHGGGEGKSPIGRPGPVTPWGKPTLGYKTRNKKARTDSMIVKRRNDK